MSSNKDVVSAVSPRVLKTTLISFLPGWLAGWMAS